MESIEQIWPNFDQNCGCNMEDGDGEEVICGS